MVSNGSASPPIPSGTSGEPGKKIPRKGFWKTLAVFFALQRYFVRGLLAGSVKG